MSSIDSSPNDIIMHHATSCCRKHGYKGCGACPNREKCVNRYKVRSTPTTMDGGGGDAIPNLRGYRPSNRIGEKYTSHSSHAIKFARNMSRSDTAINILNESIQNQLHSIPQFGIHSDSAVLGA